MAFGIEFNALKTDETSRWTHAADTILDETFLLSILPPWMRYLGGRKDKFEKEVKWVRGQLDEHNIDKKGLGQLEDAHTTMIAELRKVKDEEGLLTEEEIMQEVLTMGGAGHETTGNTVSWALYLLAKNPEVQATLR